MTRLNSWLRRLLVCCLAVVILAATQRLWLPWFGTFLVDAGPPVKSDAIIVLAGDDSGNRILRGAELASQGYAPKVYMSGPQGHYGHSEADLAIEFAQRHGYPASLFVGVEHDGASTLEEADRMLAAVRRAGVRRILVVTSQTHTRRSGRIYRRAARDLTVNVTAAPNPELVPETWWYTREGRKAVFSEWLKTVANWLGI